MANLRKRSDYLRSQLDLNGTLTPEQAQEAVKLLLETTRAIELAASFADVYRSGDGRELPIFRRMLRAVEDLCPRS